MLAMLYGYTPSPHTPDPLVRLINKVMAEFSKAAVVGAWLVDLIPWLRHLPNWVPGTGFKRTARQWHGDFHEVMNVPINFVTEQKAQEAAKPSYVERLLQQADPISAEEEKKHIRQSAIALYSGGAETTATGLSFFFLAMALFPEVQAKAKEEIDRITGAGRLPSFQDRDRLPYVEAVVKETLRWQVLAPMGAPHVSEEDDEFRGYRIPKGAIILPSIKWFSIDPSVYKDPESLRPERFLGSGAAPSPYDYAFGFGRRICPGQLLAESSLFLTIAQSLAVFDISKAVDKETGRDVKSAVRTTPGFVAHPTPFTCRIIPRSEKCVDFIRRVESEHPWEEGDAKFLKKLSG